MSVRAFGEAEGRDRIARVVARVEARTGAELVVAVHPSAGHYRHADYLVGALGAFGAALVFVFHPHPFRSDWFPFELALAFALCTLLSSRLAVLRRLFVSRRLARDNVERTAKATFVELGIATTRRRTGVLVYASMFERDAAVVVDVGIDPRALGQDWERALEALRRATRSADVGAFVEAIAELGPSLERAVPRAHDDVDELANEPRVA